MNNLYVVDEYENSLYLHQPTIKNHRYRIPGYTNIIIGGSIIDQADWNHLHNDLDVTDVINVETEHDDTGKVPAEHLLQAQVPDDGTSFGIDKVLSVVLFLTRRVSEGNVKSIYVHCQMGGSRSPAFAYAILRGVYKVSRDEAKQAIINAMKEVDKLYPERQFNKNYGWHPYHIAYLDSVESALLAANIILPEIKSKNMKIAFILGQWSIGSRLLDFNSIMNSSRGLTGTEISLVMQAKEFVKLGHDTTIFTFCHPNQPEIWEGVKIKTHIPNLGGEKFDSVVSINEPYCLNNVDTNAVRVFSQYLNDFTYCAPGWDTCVDIFNAPCQMLIDHLEKQTGAENTKGKWNVLPLGCSPDLYSDNRIPGRVVWTSSADRGLHWLLMIWPKIKAAVPYANLKIFYNFNYGDISNYEQVGTNHPHVLEMAQRIRYMQEMIKRLKPFGVDHVGSVSREQMAKEYSEAMILAYPFSSVAFTEGFSLSIMEACGSGTLPVISDGDCLGSIYGGTVPMVKSPVEQNLDEFTNLVIRGLSDSQWHTETRSKTKEFAQNYTWPKLAKQLEQLIMNSEKYRKNNG